MESDEISSFKLSSDRALAVKEVIEERLYERGTAEIRTPTKMPKHLRLDHAGRGGSVPLVSGSSEENMRVEVFGMPDIESLFS